MTNANLAIFGMLQAVNAFLAQACFVLKVLLEDILQTVLTRVDNMHLLL